MTTSLNMTVFRKAEVVFLLSASKSDLSRTTKCDQSNIFDNYELGNA